MKPVSKREKRWRRVLAGPANFLSLLAALAWPIVALATIPPAPSNHFQDYAGVVSHDVAVHLDETLAQFERTTSDRLAILVYPRMPEDSYIGDYARRLGQAWNLDQNSATLFVFVEDRKTFMMAGPGLQPAFPDDITFDIASRVMAPLLHAGEYGKAFSLGSEAMMKAATGQSRRRGWPWSLGAGLILGALAFWRLKKTGVRPTPGPVSI